MSVHMSDSELALRVKNIIAQKRDDLEIAVTIDRPYVRQD